MGSRIRIQKRATAPRTPKNQWVLTSARRSFFQSFRARSDVCFFSASRVIRFGPDGGGVGLGAAANAPERAGGGATEKEPERGVDAGGAAGEGGAEVAARISSRGMTFVLQSSTGGVPAVVRAGSGVMGAVSTLAGTASSVSTGTGSPP